MDWLRVNFSKTFRPTETFPRTEPSSSRPTCWSPPTRPRGGAWRTTWWRGPGAMWPIISAPRGSIWRRGMGSWQVRWWGYVMIWNIKSADKESLPGPSHSLEGTHYHSLRHTRVNTVNWIIIRKLYTSLTPPPALPLSEHISYLILIRISIWAGVLVTVLARKLSPC